MKWLQQSRAQDRCPLCRANWAIKLSDEPLDNHEHANHNINDDDVNQPPQQQQQAPQRARPRRALPIINDMQ